MNSRRPLDAKCDTSLRNRGYCGIFLVRRFSIGLALFLAPGALFAQALLDGLAKPLQGRSMRATSAFRKGADGQYDPKADPLMDDTVMSNWDRATVKPGETYTVLDAEGPGVITHIWFTFLGPEPHQWAPDGSANHQEMLLRIYYDGQEKPGVEAPLGDFFANAFGKRSEVISLPVVVEDADSYNCFWRMPFRKSLRLEIVNQGDKDVNKLYYNVDWIKLDALPEDTPYFYAQYRQEYPVKHGQDYVLLDTKGKGHYVGTLLSVRMRSPAWFGEGDEKIYIDGEAKPSIWGTGTEDYFLSAWGLKKCKTPYFGVPYFDQRGVGGLTSSYRWHLCDPIVFNTGIKVTIEHFGWMSEDENPNYKAMSWNEREDDFSSVAYWYQTGVPTFTARAPGAKERKLPSLDRTIVYAQDFRDAKHHGSGTVRAQAMPQFHDERQLTYKPEAAGEGWIEIPFKVEKKEPLRLLVKGTRAPDFGRYQASLNGVKLGRPLDFYAAEVEGKEFFLMDFWPEPGDYALRLDCLGKNVRSEGLGLGVESVRLRERRPRVEKMGHDKDKDWRVKPLLY
ncbi:MAG: DUF2961 domain-containing protein [Pirellulales bacterium]|nr:DUF2961 domain-containing protein [Pirellulales bacterium]